MSLERANDDDSWELRHMHHKTLTPALLLAASLTMGACGSEGSDAVRATDDRAITSTTAPSPSEAESATSVGDSDGRVRGTITKADEEAQRRRVLDRAVEEGYITPDQEPDRKTKREILQALMTVEGIEVRDEKGQVVGYLTTRFVSVDGYPAALAEAEQTLERLKP